MNFSMENYNEDINLSTLSTGNLHIPTITTPQIIYA